MKYSNSENLIHALDYLARVISARMTIHFSDNENATIELPNLAFFEDGSKFSKFIGDNQPNFEEYIILLLALVPHIQPTFIEGAIRECLDKEMTDISIPELGGTRDNENHLFLPTGETVMFILAGTQLEKRFEVQHLLSTGHWFAEQNVLSLDKAKAGQPHLTGQLLLAQDYIDLFTIGEITTPKFGSAFPAQEIKTELEWQDLVLEKKVFGQIEEIKTWVEFNEKMISQWDMKKKIRPGYRALFYGPSGTGKTLASTLLGRYTNRKVYRVDLSTIVSKYIGETEKNLSHLFDKANNRGWILCFDEADALFGKRTGVKDAHDRFANQEVSYLLQRVEEFDGLIILTSNFKANIDQAFLRRFNAVIEFPFPAKDEREKIWKISFPDAIKFEEEENFPEILSHYELAGGSIINVVHYSCLQAASRSAQIILLKDVFKGIKKEMEKEGGVFKILNTGNINVLMD